MAKDISDHMVLIAQQMGARFYLNERPIAHQEVFSPTGLLPALAKRADQLASLCLGYGLGISFEDANASLLGSRVIFDNVTPMSLRLFYLVDILSELIRGGMTKDYTPLDELIYD